MKKRKFLTLLPMVALLLSGCQTQVVPSDTPSSEESESSSEGSSPSESTSEGSSPSESTSEGSSPSESTSEGTSPSESSGGDETTGSQDSGSSNVPGVSTISYEVKIVSENTSLTQYDSMTLDVELYMYEYKEGDPTKTLISTTKSSEVSDGVSLTTDNESIIGIDGLVISALEVGTANITAHWNVDDAIYDSDPVEFSVSEYIPTYTYKAKITSDLSEIEIGEHLVEVYLYTYADGQLVNPDGVKASASDVTLTSEDSSIIETTEGSLTIKALATGTTTLTAEWIGHIEATDTITITVVSSGDTGGTTPEPTPEPEDVYTYEVKIENKDAYTSALQTGYGHEEEDIPALKIGLYTYKNEEQESVVYPESTTEVEDLEVTSSNSELVDIKEDLTLDIKVDTELTTPVTITATWNGHYTDEDSLTVASDSVDVYISYTPYPVYIESISFTQSEYVLYYGGNEGDNSTTVKVTYSPDDVDDSSYSISVGNESVATFDPDTSTLTAVGVGETTMTVTATYGGATGTAAVKVVQGKTDLTSISLSSNTYNLEYNDGYGSFTIGVGEDASADIKVTLNPTDPDYKELSVTNSDGYLSVSETSTNYFVISVTDEAKEVLKDNSITTTLTIASTYYSNVEPQELTVTIQQTPAEIAHPVLGIELTGSVNSVDEGYTASMQYNGSLTLGNENTDITVSILPEDAYSTAWSAAVSDNDSSKSLIELTGDATDGYTISPINGSALTEDTDATVIITSEGNGSEGVPISTTLTITIIHQESQPTSLTITDYQSSVNLISGSTDTITVSYLVKDQRENEMEGLGLSADVDNTANNTDVSITPTGSAGQFVISAGSVEGTATISFYLTDYSEIKASETITVTVTDQYHAITTVSYSGEDQTINIDLGAETVYGSFTVTESMVTFSNETNDVDPSDAAQGFTLSTESEYVSIEENTITAVTGTVDGVEAIITITSVAAPSVSTTFTVTVKDVTDYSVQSLTLVDSNGNDLDSVTLTVSASEGSSDNTLESLGIYVSIKPDYATEKDYDVTITDSEYVTYSDGYISAAASKDNYSATLIVTSKDNGAASDSLTINVVTTYVKADVITVDSNIPNTMTEGDTIDLDQYVTISNSNGSDPTDQSYTVTSSNDAISVSEHTLTAESATDSDVVITITSADSSTTITFNGVEAKDKTITLSFTFYANDNSTRLTVPEDMNAYLVGDWAKTGSDWTLGTDYKLTAVADSDGNYVYQYTFEDGLDVGDYGYQILVARGDEELTYGHALASTKEFSITSADYGTTKDISYVIDYESIEAADPEIDTEKTVEVYFLVFDNYGNGFSGSVTTLASDSSIFDGNTTCGVTTGSTSHNGTQYYMYNSVKGTANPGLSDWFTFHNGSWGNQVALGTITIPEVEDGCVAIYVVDTATQSGYEWAWGTPWVPTSGLPSDAQMTNGWCTNYASVTAFINNCTGWVS